MQQQSVEQDGADSSAGTEHSSKSVMKARCVVTAMVLVSSHRQQQGAGVGATVMAVCYDSSFAAFKKGSVASVPPTTELLF